MVGAVPLLAEGPCFSHGGILRKGWGCHVGYPNPLPTRPAPSCHQYANQRTPIHAPPSELSSNPDMRLTGASLEAYGGFPIS